MQPVWGQLKGKVYGKTIDKKESLVGAKAKLLKAGIGSITNDAGEFELILQKKYLPDTLVIAAFGYRSDTLVVTEKDRFIYLEINLYSDQLLPEVLVEVRKSSHSISRLKVLHVEEIGQDELRKAACCNLSESFETNASVDVNIPDGVSGSKKIQMMGLDGVYTQLQMENIPYLRGLESSFGLSSMPGTWIESIQITKGTGNVVNGFESMAGLINFELKKPTEMERFFVNAYVNAFGRAELNLNAGHQINKKWSTGWFAHGAGMFGKIDHNHDGFKDVPNGNTAAFLNRWAYAGKKMEAQFGVNAYYDEKQGGQLESHTPNPYRVNMTAKHIDVFAKTGFFTKKPYQSFGVVYNVKYQNNVGLVGLHQFKGEEKRAYINGMFDGIIGTTIHKYKLGISAVGTDILQQLDSTQNHRVEIVPGAFFEYTYTGLRFSTVLGQRIDYHSIYGWQYVPRMHSKIILNEYTDFRFTAGKGWRVPNYIIDNYALLTTGRTWQAQVTIKPEISWNMGGSLVRQFAIKKRKMTLSADYYYTYFTNQLVVDRDADLQSIRFTNLTNTSFSHSFQLEWSWEVLRGLDLRTAYKYLDVKSRFNETMQQQVLIPKHRIFMNVGYKTRNKKWLFDATLSIYGEARLQDRLAADGVTIIRHEKSPFYPMLLGQITYIHKRWEFYIGGENLTNFKQKNPIIDAENPFGSKFDATQVWGPIMGINVYAGFRFSILKNKK